jgi:methionyl-tRNA formyltransferase
MLKIIYAGTPEFAVPALESLLQSEHQVVAVYTQPDRPAGRGRKLQQSPVKACALAAGLPVMQPQDFKSAQDLRDLQQLDADLMVVAAYGLLLPGAVLDAPRLGCINIHASLLPRWRGASPIQQAILAGDEASGVSLMKMERGLDTGDVILRRSLTIDPSWNAGHLHDALAPLGAELLLELLQDIDSFLRRGQAQENSAATYAPRLSKQQAEVDWSKSADILLREIRAYNPWPVSFSFIKQDSIRLWAAQACSNYDAEQAGRVVAHDREGVYVSCGDGVLQVTELQFAGRKRCSAGQALSAVDLSGCLLGHVLSRVDESC